MFYHEPHWNMYYWYMLYHISCIRCITAAGNAFPQLQRKTSHLVLRAGFAEYNNLIDVFSDVFPEGYSQLSS